MPDRVTLRKRKGGAITPCNACKLRSTCYIFHQVAKKINRYRRPSNILGYCDVWEPKAIDKALGRSLTWKGFKKGRPN